MNQTADQDHRGVFAHTPYSTYTHTHTHHQGFKGASDALGRSTTVCRACTHWLQTNGVNTDGAAAKVTLSLLTLSLLTLLDLNFLGNPLWTWEFHLFNLRLCLSQTP